MNPADAANLSGVATVYVENLHDAKPINQQDLKSIILDALNFVDENEEKLNLLENLREPYLFTSADLLQILEVTLSTKTRLEMINMIGPRLLDPKSKMLELTGRFRFAEDKLTVEEILKARAQTLNATALQQQQQQTSAMGGRGGSILGQGGGRGRGGSSRGRGAGRAGRGSLTPSVNMDTNKKPSKDQQSLTPVLEKEPVTPLPAAAVATTSTVATTQNATTVAGGSTVKGNDASSLAEKSGVGVPVAEAVVVVMEKEKEEKQPEISPEESSRGSSPSNTTGTTSTSSSSNNTTTSNNNSVSQIRPSSTCSTGTATGTGAGATPVTAAAAAVDKVDKPVADSPPPSQQQMQRRNSREMARPVSLHRRNSPDKYAAAFAPKRPAATATATVTSAPTSTTVPIVPSVVASSDATTTTAAAAAAAARSIRASNADAGSTTHRLVHGHHPIQRTI